jgi:DnaJ-domain-containing protein 1
LERLYHILRSYVHSGQRTTVEAEWDSGPWQQEAGGKRDAGPARDPRLAGYYANLEVPYGADLETVRSAWRRMMKKYHPDLHHSDPEKRRVANELCAELTRAYRELERVLPKEKS